MDRARRCWTVTAAAAEACIDRNAGHFGAVGPDVCTYIKRAYCQLQDGNSAMQFWGLVQFDRLEQKREIFLRAKSPTKPESRFECFTFSSPRGGRNVWRSGVAVFMVLEIVFETFDAKLQC